MTKVTPIGKDVVIIYPRLDNMPMDQKPVLPLPALAIAGPLERKGFGVKILDERIERDLTGPLSRLKRVPICFGISCMLSYQPKSGLNVAKWIRRHFPGVPIVWGGWFPTLLPEITIADPHIDIIVKGKGETTFTELVCAIYNKRPLDRIQGLIYKDHGKVIETPDRPLEDANTFPPKPYHLLDLQKYSVADGIVNFNSSHGCPFRCKFCGISSALRRQWNKGLSPERTLEDIEDLIHNYNIKLKHLTFYEDNFFNDRERARKIFQGIVERGWNITWEANLRIDQMLRFDSEMFRLIKRSGCTRLMAGAESATQPILDLLCKDIKVDQIEKAVEIARNYDLPLMLNFIAGVPGETRNLYRETLEKIKRFYEIHPRLNIRIFQYIPVPGTPLFEMEKERGLINEPKTFAEWADIAGKPFYVSPLSLRNELAKYTNRIFKIMTFYFTFGYQEELMRSRNIKVSRRILRKILRKTSVFRFERDFWYLPLEWNLARLFHYKWRYSTSENTTPSE